MAAIEINFNNFSKPQTVKARMSLKSSDEDWVINDAVNLVSIYPLDYFIGNY